MTMRPVALLIACVMLVQAQPPAVRVSWNRTPEKLAGKYVVVQMENGTKIEGSWTGVTESAFTMDVERSSGTSQRLKGAQTIPRSALQKVWFREKRVRGRVIGTLAGFYGIVAIAAAAKRSPEALQGGWGIAAIAGAVGGYQIGKSFDKGLRELILEP